MLSHTNLLRAAICCERSTRGLSNSQSILGKKKERHNKSKAKQSNAKRSEAKQSKTKQCCQMRANERHSLSLFTKKRTKRNVFKKKPPDIFYRPKQKPKEKRERASERARKNYL